MVTGERGGDLRGQMVAKVSTASRQPARVLFALEAALLRYGAPPPGSRLQTETCGAWPDAQRLLGMALPGVGGKLSEDDDGHYNIALSPELMEKTGNARQSYRGAFHRAHALVVDLYESGKQPLSGILDILIEAGVAGLIVRQSGQAQHQWALESFYVVSSADDSPRILQHVVLPDLNVIEKWTTEWDNEATTAAAEPEEWLFAAVDASLAAIAKHRPSAFGDAELRLLHCGLLKGRS